MAIFVKNGSCILRNAEVCCEAVRAVGCPDDSLVSCYTPYYSNKLLGISQSILGRTT